MKPEGSKVDTSILKKKFLESKEKKPLNHPIENQYLQRHGNKTFRVGIASMQGKRESMEDAHSAVLELKRHPNIGFFGVFDGHSGTLASKWCSENVYKGIDELEEFTAAEIVKKMIELDEKYLRDSNNDLKNGSTAVFALIQKCDDPPSPDKPYKVTAVNLGDSRCIIGRPKTREVEVMTEDHKPGNVEEEKRINAAGGFVARGRVDANLAVARAIGDHAYKCDKNLPVHQQKIIPIPDVTEGWLGPEDFLFICCDGIFESFTNEQVMEFLFYRMDKTEDTAYVLSDMLYEVLDRGSRDNMSAVIIEIKDGTDVKVEDEFIAGEYYENGNVTWMNAYKNNIQNYKISLEQAKKMWEDRKAEAREDKARRRKAIQKVDRKKKKKEKEKKGEDISSDEEYESDFSSDDDDIEEEPPVVVTQNSIRSLTNRQNNSNNSNNNNDNNAKHLPGRRNLLVNPMLVAAANAANTTTNTTTTVTVSPASSPTTSPATSPTVSPSKSEPNSPTNPVPKVRKFQGWGAKKTDSPATPATPTTPATTTSTSTATTTATTSTTTGTGTTSSSEGSASPSLWRSGSQTQRDARNEEHIAISPHRREDVSGTAATISTSTPTRVKKRETKRSLTGEPSAAEKDASSGKDTSKDRKEPKKKSKDKHDSKQEEGEDSEKKTGKRRVIKGRSSTTPAKKTVGAPPATTTTETTAATTTTTTTATTTATATTTSTSTSTSTDKDTKPEATEKDTPPTKKGGTTKKAKVNNTKATSPTKPLTVVSTSTFSSNGASTTTTITVKKAALKSDKKNNDNNNGSNEDHKGTNGNGPVDSASDSGHHTNTNTNGIHSSSGSTGNGKVKKMKVKTSDTTASSSDSSTSALPSGSVTDRPKEKEKEKGKATTGGKRKIAKTATMNSEEDSPNNNS